MRRIKIKIPKTENESSEETAQKIVEILKQKWSSAHVGISIDWDVIHVDITGESSEINQLELLLNSSVYSEKDEGDDRRRSQEQAHQDALYDA